jgi:hypothetical protein
MRFLGCDGMKGRSRFPPESISFKNPAEARRPHPPPARAFPSSYAEVSPLGVSFVCKRAKGKPEKQPHHCRPDEVMRAYI